MSWSPQTWAAWPGRGRTDREPLDRPSGLHVAAPSGSASCLRNQALPSPSGITQHLPRLLTRLGVLGDVGVCGGPQLLGGCLCQHVTSQGRQTCPDKIRSDPSYYELPFPDVWGGGVSWR